MENLLASGVLCVDPIITHEMALEDVAEGFALLARGEGSKVILAPGFCAEGAKTKVEKPRRT